MKKVKGLFLAFFVGAVFLFIFWFWASFRIYQVFTKEELFAAVTCQKSSESSFDYIIFYQPLNQKTPAAFGIKGDQWRIEGVIIKWRAFVNILGVHTWHKPVRLSGRLSKTGKAKDFETTEYVLNNGEDGFWKFMEISGKRLPFIEAFYGSGAFVPCRENSAFKVYVTTSGYIIKPDRAGKK